MMNANYAWLLVLPISLFILIAVMFARDKELSVKETVKQLFPNLVWFGVCYLIPLAEELGFILAGVNRGMVDRLPTIVMIAGFVAFLVLAPFVQAFKDLDRTERLQRIFSSYGISGIMGILGGFLTILIYWQGHSGSPVTMLATFFIALGSLWAVNTSGVASRASVDAAFRNAFPELPEEVRQFFGALFEAEDHNTARAIQEAALSGDQGRLAHVIVSVMTERGEGRVMQIFAHKGGEKHPWVIATRLWLDELRSSVKSVEG